MRKLIFFANPLSLALLCGCSVHPVQQDVTHIATAEIVEHIRCEAKDAIIEEAQNLLRAARNPQNQSEPDQQALDLANYLAADRKRYGTYKPNGKTEKRITNFYNKYIDTGIALEFAFDVTEDNKYGGTIDPAAFISGGTVKVPLGASGDFSREAIRRFIVSDTFQGLLQRNCDSPRMADNFVYPVSGRIGLSEVISTFIDLNEREILADLSGAQEDLDVDKKIPVFTDSLSYWTTLAAGTAAGTAGSIVLTPSGRGVHLADASLSAVGTRTDKHSVVIGLSLNPVIAGNVPKVTSIAITGAQPLKTVFAKTNIKSAAEERAVLAITQQRLDNFYDRATLAVPVTP